ncbi:MAG TPA: FHA domain-containing protein [Polyangiaceae bacterium]|nr:FHA domain-containing protein [Polyangiaceae bacterium]
MSTEMSPGRALAHKVAKLLVEKSRGEEAVAVLAAWAASGPNDEKGQALLAEALRLDPGSALAKMAFQRMEGVPAEQGPLDQAIATFDEKALLDIEKQYKRPVFHRAQLGFNNNVQYKGATYHVQTEDSGIDRPHVITHLFADGGRVIKSFKRTYANEAKRDDVAAFVRALMKAQHMEMVIALREGKFDEVVAGRAAGGMTVLETPPEIKVRKGAGDDVRKERPATGPIAQAKEQGKIRVRLTTVRSLWGGPDRYEPRGDDVVIGSEGEIALTGERFSAPKEAVFTYRAGKLVLTDLEGGNGVFLRTHNPVELVFGDAFLVGDQVLCLLANPPDDDGPGPGPTYFYASPRWHSSFRLVQIWEGGQHGATCVAKGTTVQIGRKVGDMTFADDPLVSDYHCAIEEQAGAVVLTDLGSRAGTFVRITGQRELLDGDEIAIGRTRLRVSIP